METHTGSTFITYLDIEMKTLITGQKDGLYKSRTVVGVVLNRRNQVVQKFADDKISEADYWKAIEILDETEQLGLYGY